MWALSKDGFGEEDWFLVRMRESIGCYWTCEELLTKTLDNKYRNQISVPCGFRESMGLVGVPILAGSQTWFKSFLLSKEFPLTSPNEF